MYASYFYTIENWWGYDRTMCDLLVGPWIITHTYAMPNRYTITANGELCPIGVNFTRGEIDDFLFPLVDPHIIETFDGYLSLYMPLAEKSATIIQQATRKYLKYLKRRRIGLAVMEILSPILYHPRSPYMIREFAAIAGA